MKYLSLDDTFDDDEGIQRTAIYPPRDLSSERLIVPHPHPHPHPLQSNQRQRREATIVNQLQPRQQVQRFLVLLKRPSSGTKRQEHRTILKEGRRLIKSIRFSVM
mmetsp:Transcript_18372/g.37607  ORF Transcript_18372/g.37607 Transcript_18372/m.37607 type:complete len:105 (+) Transcript_18372:834-1148(+)